MKIIKKAAIIAIAGALSLSMTGCGILETGIGAAIFVPAIVGIVNNEETLRYDFKAPKRGRITELVVKEGYRNRNIRL